MAKRTHPGLYWNKKTGEGSIDKRVGGSRVRHRFKAGTQQEAEAEYLAAIDRARTGQAQANQPRKLTFLDAAAQYLETATKASIGRDADSLAALRPHIGHLPLDQIHQGTLEDFIAARRGEGIKSSTLRRDLAVVRMVLTKAARVWRDPDGKPWLSQAVPLLEAPDWDDAAEPHPLKWEEQRALFQALPKHLAEMALFAVNTGQREQVVCSLRWDWEEGIPELDAKVFMVPGRPVARYGWEGTKSKEDGVIVLNRTARAVIEARRGLDPEWVFTYRGHRIDRMNNSGWRKAWRAAGLPRDDRTLAGVHNLRHTFARRLRLVGVPLETRKALMDHADGDITVHYSPAELRELLDAVERIVEMEEAPTLLRVAR
ncbi:Site-specific recombinase XerD [Methylomagnum ishizawai]|uniref:Site-specific recombinase XerD n=1 Tax=Methylomagnum ishizawai TaxID=1760988 RepID=A0A1Y6D166_9GAMM|nr:tyrosine-type recombinase/integrase [Methylomagnum ishizawai]SMF94583.1 Site-specific recombinase XerD [Methylomagnum ishizawai]